MSIRIIEPDGTPRPRREGLFQRVGVGGDATPAWQDPGAGSERSEGVAEIRDEPDRHPAGLVGIVRGEHAGRGAVADDPRERGCIQLARDGRSLSGRMAPSAFLWAAKQDSSGGKARPA
jgi:hypothetical protein